MADGIKAANVAGMSSSRTLRSILAFAVVGLSAGCGSRQSPSWTRTMPNPEGCFVQVWNDSGFAGTSDFINGPTQYGHLRDLPHRRSWKDRISSLRLGPGASAMVWSREQFSGQSLWLTADGKEQGAFAVLPLEIQSLDIRCVTQVAARKRGWRAFEDPRGDPNGPEGIGQEVRIGGGTLIRRDVHATHAEGDSSARVVEDMYTPSIPRSSVSIPESRFTRLSVKMLAHPRQQPRSATS